MTAETSGGGEKRLYISYEAVEIVVALQQIQALGLVPRPALGLGKPCFFHKIIVDGYNARALAFVHGLPCLIPGGSIVADEVVVVGPCNGYITFQTSLQTC